MKNIFLILTVFMLIFTHVSNADNASGLNKKGMKAYKENRFDDSIKSFTDALVERPDSPELNFNRGTALSASCKIQEAIEELGKASGAFKDPKNKAAAQFNMGNSLATGKDVPSAIEQYKNAIKLDQTAKDYRHNLELLMKEKRKNDQQKQDKDGKNQNDNKDKKKSDPKDQNQNQNKQQEQNKPQQQQSQNKQEMSAQEAKQLLDAIEDGEKKAFELRRKAIQNNMENKNDW